MGFKSQPMFSLPQQFENLCEDEVFINDKNWEQSALAEPTHVAAGACGLLV